MLQIPQHRRTFAGVMRTRTKQTTDHALALLGREANNVTQTADTLGISPGALLAAAWQVLERQNTYAQPWPRIVQGWCDEESANRQDVILAAVRLDAQHHGNKAA